MIPDQNNAHGIYSQREELEEIEKNRQQNQIHQICNVRHDKNYDSKSYTFPA